MAPLSNLFVFPLYFLVSDMKRKFQFLNCTLRILYWRLVSSVDGWSNIVELHADSWMKINKAMPMARMKCDKGGSLLETIQEFRRRTARVLQIIAYLTLLILLFHLCNVRSRQVFSDLPRTCVYFMFSFLFWLLHFLVN